MKRLTAIPKIRKALPALLIALAWTGCAVAQEGRPGSQKSPLLPGIDVPSADTRYRDFDREVTPLPILSDKSRWVSLIVPSLDFKLYSTDIVSLWLNGRWDSDDERNNAPFLWGENLDQCWSGLPILIDDGDSVTATIARLRAPQDRNGRASTC
ncbi:hypothetical protein [Achromobacter sp. DH1f]|uniref:hypothetical protein n=1 Tax=Achromobacter sp. DH1f TaxID=1397275 RepID=UPI0004690379|nr:hypothetical protein [Achromobacter sp. DH1f]